MPSSAPVVFLSAASVDLKAWRDHLHHAFSRAGFRVLTQEQSLRSATGDVKRLLCETIAEADCIIHLAGMGYGSHATDAFPEAPDFTCSWTQFEYYHAHQLGKDVVAFVCAPDLSRGGFVEETTGPADLLLKQRLQQAHRERVASGEFTGTPLEGRAPRTSNESVAGAGRLMESVAAAVGTLRSVQREHVERAQAQLREIGSALARLERGQRHILRWASAATVLIALVALGIWWIKRITDQTAVTVTNVARTQEQHGALLTDQRNLLQEAVAQLETLTREKAQLGVKIEDLPREAIYKELAARLNVSEVELGLHIEAGKRSTDALTRARANLLTRQFEDARAATRQAREADKAALHRIIASYEIDAESYYQEGKYAPALECRQKAAALVDKSALSMKWALAQDAVAHLLYKLARYEEAEPILREVLGFWEKLAGPDHSNVANSLNSLVLLLRETGRLAEAEPLMRRALRIHESRYGSDHPRIITSLHNLATVSHDLGRSQDAEALLRRAIQIAEKSHESHGPDFAMTLHNLAAVLRSANRHAEAEPLARRALHIWENAHGKEHPSVALGLESLASIHRHAGRHAESEQLFRRALAVYETAYGPKHPAVAVCLNNFSLLLQETRRFPEAEPMLRRALQIHEAASGKDSPATATALANLAGLLQATDRLEEAEAHRRRALQIDESRMRKNDPRLIIRLQPLAALLQKTGRTDEAESLLRRVIEIDEATHGKHQPGTVPSLIELAQFFEDIRRPSSAAVLYGRIIDIDEAALGKDHPHVARDIVPFARALLAAGDTDLDQLLSRAQKIVETADVRRAPELPQIASDLAALCVRLKRYPDAEALMRRALAMEERERGADDLNVAARLSELAALLMNLDRHAEAGPLLLRALKIDEAVNGKNHIDQGPLLGGLATVYFELERLEEAASFAHRALSLTASFKQRNGRPHSQHEVFLNNYRHILHTMKLDEAAISEKLAGLE